MKKNKKMFTPDKVKMIMKLILNAMVYLKSLKIMIRNIKPVNLIFKNAKQCDSVKLVDFSLASFENAKPLEYPNCGTPGFIAPEVINYDANYSKQYNT